MEIKQTLSDLLKFGDRAAFITQFLEKHNCKFRIIKFSHGKNIEFIKEIKNSNKEIIFFVHYDISNQTLYGANDNSSSVAVMLHAAAFLVNLECLFTIKIVFIDREEIMGALLNSNIKEEDFESIIQTTGSYQYLKNNITDKEVYFFNVELSGIGDCLYFAETSGNIYCDRKILEFLADTAEKNKINFIKIPFLSSDMISIKLLGYKGGIYGAIPELEGKKYLEHNKNDSNNEFFPASWKNIHSNKDNIFSIHEKSLEFVYNFTIHLISNLNNF